MTKPLNSECATLRGGLYEKLTKRINELRIVTSIYMVQTKKTPLQNLLSIMCVY